MFFSFIDPLKPWRRREESSETLVLKERGKREWQSNKYYILFGNEIIFFFTVLGLLPLLFYYDFNFYKSTNRFQYIFVGSLATRFHISKYPTLKVIRNGTPTKREYRGQRSSDAFYTYIKKQLEDPIKEFNDLNQLESRDVCTQIIVIYIYFDCFFFLFLH